MPGEGSFIGQAMKLPGRNLSQQMHEDQTNEHRTDKGLTDARSAP